MGGVAILAVYINYANYIWAIVVLLAYSHKYRARINNRLYGKCLHRAEYLLSPSVMKTVGSCYVTFPYKEVFYMNIKGSI